MASVVSISGEKLKVAYWKSTRRSSPTLSTTTCQTRDVSSWVSLRLPNHPGWDQIWRRRRRPTSRLGRKEPGRGGLVLRKRERWGFLLCRRPINVGVLCLPLHVHSCRLCFPFIQTRSSFQKRAHCNPKLYLRLPLAIHQAPLIPNPRP